MRVKQEEEVARAKKVAERKLRYCVKCPKCGGHLPLGQAKRLYEGKDRRETFPDEFYEEEAERSYNGL